MNQRLPSTELDGWYLTELFDVEDLSVQEDTIPEDQSPVIGTFISREAALAFIEKNKRLYPKTTVTPFRAILHKNGHLCIPVVDIVKGLNPSPENAEALIKTIADLEQPK